MKRVVSGKERSEISHTDTFSETLIYDLSVNVKNAYEIGS